MNGIFGGFLAIVDSIGGGFLYILIGEAASRSGAGARLVRLVLGALLFGAIVSIAIYMFSPEMALQKLAYQNTGIINDGAFATIFLPPVASLVLTAALELFRFGIEHSVKRPDNHDLRITPTEETVEAEHTKQAPDRKVYQAMP